MIGWVLSQIQCNSNLVIGGLGGGVAVAGIVSYIIHRQVKKVVEHADDTSRHIPPGVRLVGMDKCELISNSIKENVQEGKEAINHVHARLDDLGRSQAQDTLAILAAIGKIKD